MDMQGTNFFKSDTGEIKVEGVKICGSWTEYFEVLLSWDNDRELEVVEAAEGPLHEIAEQEVKRAMTAQ